MRSTHPDQELGALIGQGCSDTDKTPLYFLMWQVLTVQYCACFFLGWIVFLKPQLRLWFLRGICEAFTKSQAGPLILGYMIENLNCGLLPPHPPLFWRMIWLYAVMFKVMGYCNQNLHWDTGPSICWYVTGAFFIHKMRMYLERQVYSRKASRGLKHFSFTKWECTWRNKSPQETHHEV